MLTAEHSFIVNRVELIAVVSPEDLREKGAAYSEIPLERWKEKKICHWWLEGSNSLTQPSTLRETRKKTKEDCMR